MFCHDVTKSSIDGVVRQYPVKPVQHGQTAAHMAIMGNPKTEPRVGIVELLMSVCAEAVLEVAIGAGGEWKQWAMVYGAYLGRYRLEGNEPTYQTATCTVWKAADMLDNSRKVVLGDSMLRSFGVGSTQDCQPGGSAAGSEDARGA